VVVREAVEVPVKRISHVFLDVEVLHIERIFFNELTAWFHGVSHQDGENVIGEYLVVDWT